MRARVAPLLLAAVTVLALAGGACSSGDSDSADPTLPPEPAVTTATAPADPYAIPKVIDEAYVNRVLAALSQIAGDALRTVIASGNVSSDVSPMLRSIYNDPQFEQELENFVGVFRNGFEPFKIPPGNRKRTVQRLISVGPTCIFAEVVSDFSAVLKEPKPDPPDEVEILTLRLTQEGADPGNLNPTPWSIGNAEVISDEAAPAKRATCDV